MEKFSLLDSVSVKIDRTRPSHDKIEVTVMAHRRDRKDISMLHFDLVERQMALPLSELI